MIETQLNLEQEMFSLCSEKYLFNFNNEKEKNFSSTKSGTILIKNLINDYAGEIQKSFDETLSGKAGRHAIAVECLKEIGDTRKIAYLTIRAVFNILYQQPKVHKVVNAIAETLDDEITMTKFKTKNRPYYEKVLTDLNKRNANIHWKKTVMVYKFQEKEKLFLSHWNRSQKQHVGLFLLEHLIPFNIVEIRYLYECGKTIRYVIPSKELLDMVENLNNKIKFLSITFEPMVCKPKEWTGIYDGGYLTPFKRCKFIKHNDTKYLERAESFGLATCYQAVNLLQATAWKINKQILSIAEEMWESNISSGGIPSREDLEIPAFPYPDKSKSDLTKKQKEEIKIWKQNATQLYRKNIQLRSLRLSTVQTINTAKKFSEYDKIYFPYQIDFRGRVYPIPILLNPQSFDLAKGLLTFAEGKPLDENGLKWMKIHIANCWGLSKLSYAERLEWVDHHTPEIISYSKNPMQNTDWMSADKPFQFLASCMELSGYLNSPDNFISTLPVYVDGACNGLQHYSALLSDEKAGKSVNLIDSDKPNDIYQVVADNLIEKLHKAEDKNLSQKWLTLGINRKLTKRPVMTLAYGATKFSCRDYIKDYLLDNYDINYLHEYFGKCGSSPSNTVQVVSGKLADILWEAIRECLPSAVETMDYLRNVTRIEAKKQKPIEWVTPLGLLVNQTYLATKQYRINTEVAGSLKVYKYRGEIKKYDTIKQVNGICPNFIHSLDASCLMLWLLRSSEAEIKNFTAVHDSYGVLAQDMELSQQILRNAFVEIYSSYNILEKFVDDITTDLTEEEKEKLPNPPQTYNLDINNVLTSKYFFS